MLPATREVTIVAVVGLVALATPLRSQEAQQGTSAAQRFTSPMVVEIPLPASSRVDWRRVEHIERIQQFRCEGVYVEDVSVRVHKTMKGSNGLTTVEVEARLTFANERGHDKYVALVAELLDPNGVVLGTVKLAKVEVEEEKQTTRSLKWPVAETFPSDPSAVKLRLTISVVET